MRLWNVVFFSVIDLAGAGLFAWYHYYPFSQAFWFWAALAFLWLSPLVLGLFGLVKFWLAYHLYLKRRMVRFYKAEMYKHKFPTSNGFYDWDAYLASIVDSNEVKEATKLKAVAFVAEIATYKTERPFTMFLAMQSALQSAMDIYQAPPSTSGLFSSAESA